MDFYRKYILLRMSNSVLRDYQKSPLKALSFMSLFEENEPGKIDREVINRI